MALDPRYVIAPSLEMYFVNKDTGLPLVNGEVRFFHDNARTVPKDVYQLVGGSIPGDYSYAVLPNPSFLSAVGTFQDNTGNDIIPYYLPYVSLSDSTVDLYYIEVYDSMGVLQFTREAWPNFTSSNNNVDQDVTNFIANGQFFLHDDVPASSANNFVAGEISADTTVIAQGGWTFERGPTSTATDFVTFPAFASPITNPTGNPLYAVQIQCTVAGSDTRKDLCIQFPNVNTFASGSQNYNFYFEALSNSGTLANVQIIVRKFYGTGGSPSATTEDIVSAITLTTGSYKAFNTTILFGTNAGKSMGTNNDSYVQICVRFPPTSIFSASLTNFALTLDDFELIAFPPQTEAAQKSPATAGALPAPAANGGSLYLPIVYGPTGFVFDSSSIGGIEGLMIASGSQSGNLLFCDGAAYLTNDYSALGIPYARLQAKLFNVSANGPLFGTGVNFVNTYINSGATSQMFLVNNKAGVQANAADVGTGFAFNAFMNAGVPTINYSAYANTSARLVAISTLVGTVSQSVGAGTSGFGVANLKQIKAASNYYSFEVAPTAGSTLVTGGFGLYFDFSSTSVDYRMWFQTGTEMVPAAGGRTLILCNIVSTMSSANVAAIIAARISSEQTTTISVTGVPAAGTYFTFSANAITYYVWYQVNGAGTAPAQPFAQLIKVVLTGAETNAQVATKTQAAINSQYFAVPNLQGQFLRGNDITGLIDLNLTDRYAYYAQNNAGALGTFEVDSVVEHNHDVFSTAPGGSGSQGGQSGSFPTGNTGVFETRPINASVNYFIRY